MVNRRNLQDTVLHLMLTLRRAEQPFRDDVVLSVLEMGANDRYALLTDFAWCVHLPREWLSCCSMLYVD